MPPSFSVAPVATAPTGILIGETVQTTDGTYTGDGVVVTYQWRRDGVPIGGAVANSYVLTAADIGPLIDCVVTLTGICGIASADSNDLEADVPLFNANDMACGRATEGSYLSSIGIESWWGPDELRFGDRGILVERSFTNYNFQSVQVASPWAALNAGSTLTPGDVNALGTAPDNTQPASVSFGASAVSILQHTIGTAPAADTIHTFYGFLRGAIGGGGELLRVAIGTKAGSTANLTALPALDSTFWSRFAHSVDVGSGASSVISRIQNGADGLARSFRAHGLCTINSRYPKTTVRTLAAPVTTSPDVVTALAPQIPLRFRTGVTDTGITPHWAAADLQPGEIRWLWTFGVGGLNGARVHHTGGSPIIEALVGGVVVATSPVLTNAREQRFVAQMDPAAGIIRLNGVPGPAGTPWTWPGGVEVRWGGVLGSAGDELDGYMELPVAA